MASRGVNKVILLGHIGDDPETKYTQSGMAVTTVRLATTSVRKDRDGNQQERTEWHRVKFFGKLGEIAGEYLRKGSQCYVEGSIRYDKFTGQDGQDRYITEIVADEMQMLGGRPDGGQRESSGRGGSQSHSHQSQRQDQAPSHAAGSYDESFDHSGGAGAVEW